MENPKVIDSNETLSEIYFFFPLLLGAVPNSSFTILTAQRSRTPGKSPSHRPAHESSGHAPRTSPAGTARPNTARDTPPYSSNFPITTRSSYWEPLKNAFRLTPSRINPSPSYSRNALLLSAATVHSSR